jgi:hypothetical protein
VESAEKWAARLIPLASSAVGGAMNFTFVRGWGRRVQRHLRARHMEARPFGSVGGGSVSGTSAGTISVVSDAGLAPGPRVVRPILVS